MVQALQQAGTYLPIEDHGIIGDLHTVALVGKNGTKERFPSAASG